jgi:hypothetical protein
MNKAELLKKYYTNSIQIHTDVIGDIIDTCLHKNLKVLVFGLGYDSNLWYNLSDNNTFFVEDNQDYIDLNKDIPQSNIVKYKYKTTVEQSFDISDEEILVHSIPEELLKLGPFDIIIIDGPAGYAGNRPGRLLPIYWSKTYLSKPGTIIYIDDCKRRLEKHCIDRFLIDYRIKHFQERSGCDKFIISN